MKKLSNLSPISIIVIIAFMSVVFIPILAIGAGTITGEATEIKSTGNAPDIMTIEYTVTFGSDASSPANVALNSILDAGGGRLPLANGWWLLSVDYMYGATGPTIDSDLFLWRSYGENKIDVLGGSGVDLIDIATNHTAWPATVSRPLNGYEIIDFDNNLVNNAGCIVVFTLYRRVQK